jgi:GNAT superfamily N-acetyltransferase
MGSAVVRPARPRELPALCTVEARASELFAEVGLAFVSEEGPTELGDLEEACAEGRLFVVDEQGAPIGFALLDTVDGQAYLAEISVLPEHGRRGLGARLLDFVCAWAASRGYEAITLTTFREVAWNGPFYRKHGFEPVSEADVGPEMCAIRARERSRGLDSVPREVLRRPLGSLAPS